MKEKFVFATVPVMELWNPPAALAALTPIIQKAGLEVNHLDLNLDLSKKLSSDDWDTLIDWCSFVINDIDTHILNEFQAVIQENFENLECTWFSISVFTYYSARPTNLVLQYLKKNNKNFKIILGGVGCMSSLASFGQKPFGSWCLEQGLADHVIYADGELALQALLENNLPYPGVDNENFEQIKNLDDIPGYDYTSMDFNKYKDPRILITGSRGCVRKCTFCDVELTWPKYAYRKPESIVDEMRRHVGDLGVTKFEFTDSLINGSTSHFAKFNELLAEARAKELDMKNVTYMGQAICRNKEHMKPYVYEFMHYAGCSQLHIGIESFSERVRYHMKKKFSDADIDYHLEQCSRWSIPNIFLMIVGYPTETLADHQAQIRALKKYQVYSQSGAIFMMRWGLTMHIYENTPLTKLADELQLMTTSDAFHDSLFTWVSGVNPDLDLRERIRRRLELHELSMALGYSMPHARKELASLLALAEHVKEQKTLNSKLIPLKIA